MGMYKVVERPGEGLARIRHPRYGIQVWTLIAVRTRQSTLCALCGNAVGAKAYRPATNSKNRGQRACRGCIEGAVLPEPVKGHE